MRICSICKENYVNSKTTSYCRICRNAYEAERRKNPKVKLSIAEWRKNNKNIQQYHKKYYENNKEKLLDDNKVWVSNNPEKRKITKSKYYQKIKNKINSEV